MAKLVTTEGSYRGGVIIPKQRPKQPQRALITFLPSVPPRLIRSDEAIWKEVAPLAHKIRRELFKRYYPSLYAKRRA